MKTVQLIIAVLITLTIIQSVKAQETISLDDFKLLNNTSWKGELTYIDYQDGTPVSIPSTMQIRITDTAIDRAIQYSYEPDRNFSSITKIRKKGTHLDNQKVITKCIDSDGSVLLVTTNKGKDDNKKAFMTYTFEFNGVSFKVTKEVQFEGTEERFIRNTYDYKKVKQED
ncbi:hypothetical protein OAE12_00265 [bacterium]|nr:hypothetical protein [bacterium]